MSDEMKERIEELVMEAYEIGYAHGGNAMRVGQGQPPTRVDDGWGPVAARIVLLIEAAGGTGENGAKE